MIRGRELCDAFAAMGTSVCGLLGLVVPTVMAVTIDDAIPRADRDQLTLLCAFLVAVAALAFASFQVIETIAARPAFAASSSRICCRHSGIGC